MRVALVIERFEPGRGGGEHVAWNVARELVNAGDDVHILCRQGDDAPGLTVERLATPSFWQPVRVRAFARNVRRALAGEDFDAVHSFSRTLNQDVMHVGGGSHFDYMQKTYGRHGARLRHMSPRHRTLLSLERRIFADPKLIAQCVSSMVQREIADRYGVPKARLPVIYCGVDIERFSPTRQGYARSRLREEFSAGNNTVWLLAGSGWRRKGLDVALEALALTSDTTTQLWVAGKDDPARWRALATRLGLDDRVRFLGERLDLEQVYAAADGLILPSRYDAFGLVCLEAAAAGLPVVTNRSVGASELFEECGVVIEHAEDARAYAKAIDALALPAARKELGDKALEMAGQHDWREHVAKLRRLYRGGGAVKLSSIVTDATEWIAGNETVQQVVDEWLATPEAFENRVLSQSAYRRVVEVSSPELEAPIAIKEFQPAGSRPTFAKRLTAQLKGLVPQSGPQREWDALTRLTDAGVAVARPLAFGRRRAAGALIVTRYVPNAETLGVALKGYAFEQRRMLRNVGQLVRELHDSGYLHGDLHIGNILIGEKGPVLVDLQQLREIKEPEDRIRDLAFLDFSLRHLGVTRSNRLRFRIAALGLGHFRVAPERQLLRDIGQASRERGVEYFAGRTRRTLRTGEGFSRISHDGWSGLRHDDFSEATIDRAIRAHDLHVRAGGDEMIKCDHRSQVSAVAVDDQRYVVKQVVKTSLRKQLADHVRGSAAQRAWVGGHGLRLRGIDAALPIAFLEKRRFGVPVESLVVLEDLSASPCVADITKDHALAESLPKLLVKFIIALHGNHVIHGDLQAIHIYLRKSRGVLEPALIDLEGVRFSQRLPDRDRIQMLAQLNASIGEDIISTATRIEMMDRYLRALPFDLGNERALRQIASLSDERDQLWKTPVRA